MTSVTNSCGTTTYTWDARNRLVGISGFDRDCNPLSASFKYDALGRRIEKTVNGKTTRYLYDGLDIVQEIENVQVTVNYIRTLNIDEPLARVKADGSVRYYQTDALGSVIALTNDSGVVKTIYAYDPFGNTTVTGEASDNPFQYTGRENDGPGLYYYRARYYSPELQRFISEDPIRLDGGNINFFSYTKNNPINYKDPDGLQLYPPVPIVPYLPPLPPSPPLPSCPPSPENCDHYPKNSIRYWVCMNAGNNPWANCVRKCLRDSYMQCSSWSCQIKDHITCWVICPGGRGASASST